MRPVQFKPKTLIYFITFFFTGLGLLHEILKQKGIEKIKELYMKKLSLSLHKIGVIEENKPEGYVVVGGFVHVNQVLQKKTYYLDSQVKGQSSLPTILIFHDSGLSSNTWLKLGLLHELNVNGYRAVVIDLPGHGGSDKTEIISDQDEKVAYINSIVERFGMGNYVLVVPGFSGQYVMPFIFSQDPEIDTGHNLSGLITISPETVSNYTEKEFKSLSVPTLIFYGEYDSNGEVDSRTLRKIPGAEVKMIYEGSRNCYIDQPAEFTTTLISFLNSLPAVQSA